MLGEAASVVTELNTQASSGSLAVLVRRPGGVSRDEHGHAPSQSQCFFGSVTFVCVIMSVYVFVFVYAWYIRAFKCPSGRARLIPLNSPLEEKNFKNSNRVLHILELLNRRTYALQYA
jgi:hypothetical protein